MQKTKILEFLLKYEKEIQTLVVDEQGKFSKCQSISQSETLMANLPEKRRLSGIKITSEFDQIVKKFSESNFSFFGDGTIFQIAYERKKISDSISLFVFTNLTEELSVLSIKFASSRSFIVCQLEVYALSEQCGHPEIPINGRVDWQRGSPNATYSCNEEYFLEPNSETRTCEEGKWSGSELICKQFNFKIF